MALTSLARKISKIIYFILLFLVLGRALPRPETYLDYDIARDICHFLFGIVNADTMYDTFFYISLIIVIFWICPYISRHLLSLNPLLARCRRYSRGER
ncbi:TPA: hypothetical protein ACQ3AQ_005396 [Klebsiella pneumoniae]